MKHEPSQAAEVRTMLQEAAARLEQAQTSLKTTPPDYRAVLAQSLEVIRLSLRALLRWHRVPFDQATPLSELARRATQLASALVTPTHLALQLAEVEPAVRDHDSLSIAEREAIVTGFYTARNTLWTTLGELPASVVPPRTLSPATEWQDREAVRRSPRDAPSALPARSRK